MKKTKHHISVQQLLVYGTGGIIPIALFNIAGQLVALIGNISLGLSAFWLGVILIIPRLWDAISDPIVGHFSDNYRSRWGRRRPFILIGGFLVAISFVLMWWIPDGEMVQSWFSSEQTYQWFTLFYILIWVLIFFTACTLFEIPHGALGMELTNDPHERTRLFSAKSFFGNLFAMSTPWIFALANLEYFKGVGGNEADGMKYVSMLISAMLIPLAFWWFKKLKEPRFLMTKTQKKTMFWTDIKRTFKNRNFLTLVGIVFTLSIGFNFVNLLGYYIPIFYIFEGDKVGASTLLGINGTVWAITGVLAVFPLNSISPKWGKQKTLLFAVVLMCLAQLSKIVCYNQDYPYLVLIPTVLLSMGMLFFFTLASSMVGDICDEDELKTGLRSEGSYYSIFWWFIKMGTALASFVAGVLILFSQFDEDQVTKVDSFQATINETQSVLEDWASAYETHANEPEKRLNELISIYNEEMQSAKAFVVELDNSIKRRNNDKDHFAREELAQLEESKLKVEKIVERAEADLSEGSQNLGIMNLDSDNFKHAFSAILAIRLIKADVSIDNLERHLKNMISEKNQSKAHYDDLVGVTEDINEELSKINHKKSSLAIKVAFQNIKEKSAILTKQTPRSLLLMRVVEIGIPLILCLIPIVLTTRYKLTDSRCEEIKRALDARSD